MIDLILMDNETEEYIGIAQVPALPQISNTIFYEDKFYIVTATPALVSESHKAIVAVRKITGWPVDSYWKILVEL